MRRDAPIMLVVVENWWPEFRKPLLISKEALYPPIHFRNVSVTSAISFALRIPGMAVKPYDFPQIGSGDAGDAAWYEDAMASCRNARMADQDGREGRTIEHFPD